MCAGGLSGCSDTGTRRELDRLSARVDSFAVTLTDVVAALERQRSVEGGPAIPDSAVASITGAATRGDSSAPVLVLEFTDYQCPYCKRHFIETVPGLDSVYVSRGKVRYGVRNLPLPFHKAALPAAIASYCALVQDERLYWAYHDALFLHQEALSDSLYDRIARSLGLDLDAFERCRRSDQTRAAILADRAAAQRAGLTGTPSFVIGRLEKDTAVRGMIIRGAQPFPAFRSAIESALMTDTPPSEPHPRSRRQ